MRTFITLFFFLFVNYSIFAQTVVPRPQNLKASKEHSEYINVNWDYIRGCKNFMLYRSGHRDMRNKKVVAILKESASFQDDDRTLIPGKSYFYSVLAEYNNKQWSALSDPTEGRRRIIASDQNASVKIMDETDCLSLSIETVDSSRTGFIELTYQLSNSCEKDFPVQSVRFYASKDSSRLSKDFTFLKEAKTSTISANGSPMLAERLVLSKGTWFVFILRGPLDKIEEDKIDKACVRKVVVNPTPTNGGGGDTLSKKNNQTSLSVPQDSSLMDTTIHKDMFAPDIFTPNGDGVNDTLKFHQLENHPEKYKNNELIVLNRWGKVVFQAKPYKNDWKGTDEHGKDLPEGTYYYILRLEIGTGYILRGDFLIVR